MIKQDKKKMDKLVGKEVEVRSDFPVGKFSQPTFVRVQYDGNEEWRVQESLIIGARLKITELVYRKNGDCEVWMKTQANVWMFVANNLYHFENYFNVVG